MESFFRYISYVDYYKKGERIKNVGFLRWKLHNGEHCIELQLKDIFSEQGSFDIKEQNTGKRIGEIKVDKGVGNFMKKFPAVTASGEMYIDTLDDRLYMDDVKGFVIWLNSNEYLSVPVKLGQERKTKEFAEIVKEDGNLKEKKNEDQKMDHPMEEPDLSNDKEILIQDTKAASENVLIEGIEEKYIDSSPAKKMKIIEPIHEDKWKQLCKKYPQVHPFPDKKVFLSVKPEDFIILQQGYQKLVHNSFLLHGFYNYGHMILGKLSEEDKAPIYIGVPGVYYEREKQAAQMFGFVGFESTEHPVQAGSYGYYMIEVEI